MADEELTLDFELFGVDPAMKSLMQVARMIDRLPARVSVLVDVVYQSNGSQIQADLKRIGQAVSRTAQNAGGRNGASPQFDLGQKQHSGPVSQSWQAWAQDDGSFDAQFRLWKAQRATAKAHQQMQQDPFQVGPRK